MTASKTLPFLKNFPSYTCCGANYLEGFGALDREKIAEWKKRVRRDVAYQVLYGRTMAFITAILNPSQYKHLEEILLGMGFKVVSENVNLNSDHLLRLYVFNSNKRFYTAANKWIETNKKGMFFNEETPSDAMADFVEEAVKKYIK